MIKANGRLRHRFWGNYSALIGLWFEDPASAKMAQMKLGSDWVPGKSPDVLVWTGDSKALEQVKQVLGGFGADTEKIDSLAKSVDYGEPFTVEIPASHPDQLELAV